MKSNIRVLKSALPLYLEGTNGKAVLVQHGYNGYPTEMYGLAKRLHAEGYTVIVPRLPGHATSLADFKKTNWKLWYQHVRNEYLNLQSKFDSVSIAAVSMGALLAILLAAEFQPEKIILLAPAVAIKQRILYLAPFLKIFLPKLKRKRNIAPDADEDRIYMEEQYWSYHRTAMIANFVKIMKMAKKHLNEVDCPYYVMLSEKDSTVLLEAGDIIEKEIGAPPVDKVILKNSPHVFFEGPENDFVIDKVAQWMKENQNAHRG